MATARAGRSGSRVARRLRRGGVAASAAAGGDGAGGAAASGAATAAEKSPPCPTSVEAQVAQATGAVLAARDAGVARCVVELELPTPYASDLDDWPGGIRQQLLVLQPLVETLMKDAAGGAAVAVADVLDDGDGVVVLSAGAAAKAKAVTFPTADVLGELRDLAEAAAEGEMLLLMNPQWSTSGQIISDFGFGPWKRRNEEFVGTFEPVYALQRLRIKGEQVQLLKCYPFEGWQVFVIPLGGGAAELVAREAERPEYWALEKLLTSREGSIASQDWVTRAKSEFEFNAKSMQKD